MSGGPATLPVQRSALVDELLARHRAALGGDFDGYRGHVLRVLTYAVHFFASAAGRQPSAEERRHLEAALAFHDLGLWVDGRPAYLEPSAPWPPPTIARSAWASTRSGWSG